MRIFLLLTVFWLTSLVGHADTGTIAFHGVKVGECNSIRVFGKDAKGDFLFITADLPRKASEFSVSDIASKQVPAGKTIIEEVKCFTRRNKQVSGTPTPGGFLTDPYVGLVAPLLTLEIKAGETVYLGGLELHKVGWGAGLITHDYAASAGLPENFRKTLLNVNFDVEATLGLAKDSSAINANSAEVFTTLANDVDQPPPSNGKGVVGLHFKSDGLECRRVDILLGSKRGESYSLNKTLTIKRKSETTPFGRFDDGKIKSGRKHLLDVQCTTDKGIFSLTPLNANRVPKYGWSSHGQFDVHPSSETYIGALTLKALPFGDFDVEKSIQLGMVQVKLDVVDGQSALPADFGASHISLIDQQPQFLEKQARVAKLESGFNTKFHQDLSAFLEKRKSRLNKE